VHQRKAWHPPERKAEQIPISFHSGPLLLARSAEVSIGIGRPAFDTMGLALSVALESNGHSFFD
jgi:hypothetical protein